MRWQNLLIPYKILKHQELDSNQKLVLVLIYGVKEFYLTWKTIRETLWISQSTYYKACRVLEENWLIEVNKKSWVISKTRLWEWLFYWE